MGDEGDRRLDRRPVDPAQRGDRRHDPGLAHARARRAARAEVEVAQQVLQSMGLRSFLPQVVACPGCGRTTSTFFQEMAQRNPGLPARPDAGVARDASGRRKTCASRSWAASSTAPANRSTPTSASACRARSRSRSRRCSSTAASRPARRRSCAVLTSSSYVDRRPASVARLPRREPRQRLTLAAALRPSRPRAVRGGDPAAARGAWCILRQLNGRLRRRG